MVPGSGVSKGTMKLGGGTSVWKKSCREPFYSETECCHGQRRVVALGPEKPDGDSIGGHQNSVDIGAHSHTDLG